MNRIDRRRKSLLILECDSNKLKEQNLALGSELQSQTKLFLPRNPVELVGTTSEAYLLETFAALFKEGRQYKNIVIIGHSNSSGLQLFADRFVGWEGLANWINPFDPQRVILLACQAGQWLPCAALFNGIPKLNEIFGSPILANRDQRLIVLGKLLHILGSKKEDANLNQLMQLGNFLITRGIMFSRSRAEYERGGDESGEFWTRLAEPFINQIINRR